MKSPHAWRIFALLTLVGLAAGCRPESSEPVREPSPQSFEAPELSERTPEKTPEKISQEVSEKAVATPAPEPAAETASQRSLPMPKSAKSSTAGDEQPDAATPAGQSPNVDAEMGAGSDEYEIDPDILAHINAQRAAMRRLADTYDAPPGAKQLGKQPDLWVDMKAKRVYVDGYVAMQRGPLEMLACPVGTKEHESVIAVFAKSSEVHAALLAIGAQSGHPVRWNPEFSPPTGQTIRIWIAWRKPQPQQKPTAAPEPSEEDNDGLGDDPAEEFRFVPSEEFSVVDARKWVRNLRTKEELSEDWVFAGSEFWFDPDDKIEHYSADAGDMICVSNFTTAMLDVPFQSSADTGSLMFEPFTQRVPERGTPVRLVLVPQPMSGDEATASPGDVPPGDVPPGEASSLSGMDPSTPPDESMLPIGAEAAAAAAGLSADSASANSPAKP